MKKYEKTKSLLRSESDETEIKTEKQETGKECHKLEGQQNKLLE